MNNIHVRLVGNIPNGFSENKTYPVHHIDVYDIEDKESERGTDFLLSNDSGEFIWVSSNMTRCSRNEQRPNTHETPQKYYNNHGSHGNNHGNKGPRHFSKSPSPHYARNGH